MQSKLEDVPSISLIGHLVLIKNDDKKEFVSNSPTFLNTLLYGVLLFNESLLWFQSFFGICTLI